jgi:hypothetical protein
MLLNSSENLPESSALAQSEPGSNESMPNKSLQLPVCCGVLHVRHWQRSAIAVLALTTIVATLAATYFAGVASEATRHSNDKSLGATSETTWAGLPIANATAAVTSEKFSMCTGPMSDQGEALFVLDHNSGLLQCSVLYPRIGRFMASFTVNVADALGLEAKGGSYIMATGTADFPSASNRPVGLSVVYVLDTASGNYACYAVPFDRTMLRANQPQQGLMVLIGQGTANPVADRDELR